MEEPGPLVSVGPAEPSDLFLVFIRVPSSAVRGHNVFNLSVPACSGPSPNTWSPPGPTSSLPDFSCLFLSTLLSPLLSSRVRFPLVLPDLLPPTISLSLFGSLLTFPGPFLYGSVYRTHTTKALSPLMSGQLCLSSASVSPARTIPFSRRGTLHGSMPGSCLG